jgi:hypothetical protein
MTLREPVSTPARRLRETPCSILNHIQRKEPPQASRLARGGLIVLRQDYWADVRLALRRRTARANNQIRNTGTRTMGEKTSR